MIGGEWEDDLQLALAAAAAAGRRIMTSFRTEQKIDYKTPSQPVTLADLEADQILHERLLGARPGYGWLSEETADTEDRLTRDRVWLVDPIDGTRSYVAGRPEFAVSIALAEHGSIVLGVVANPATGETFFGAIGQGAFCRTHPNDNPKRLQVSATQSLDGACMVVSRSERKRGDFDALPQRLDLHPLGSTAYKLARTAEGKCDIFLSRGPKSEWDIAAGHLLVHEAGGSVTTLRGERIRYNQPQPNARGILASNGVLHTLTLELMGKLPALPVGAEEETA